MSEIESNPDTSMILTILQLTQSMNLRVIAEGIETQEQLDYLVASGCKLGQGYFLSKPASFEGYVTMLQK